MQLTDKTESHIKEIVRKRYPDFDIALLDVKAHWDSALSKKENWTNICLIYNLNEKSAIEVKAEEIKAEAQHHELIQEMAKAIQEKENEAIQQIKTESVKIDKYFWIPMRYIETIAKSEDDVYSLILEGETGLGKTHITAQTLNNLGLIKGKDYEILSGYCTPLEFYTFLFDNREKLIVLDDIPSIFQNEVSYHILLSILWNITKIRTISYKTTSEKLKIPETFDFKGRIIFLTNELPKGTEALKSRCLYYKMNFKYADKIKIMYEIGKIRNIPLLIMDYIKENTDETTENLNFRTLIKAYGIYKLYPKEWEKLIIEQLPQDYHLRLIKELAKQYMTVDEQVKAWNRQCGMSRASYFRIKSKLEKSLNNSSV